MQIGVITNPNSRKNKNRPDRAARLQSIVGDLGEVHQTDTVESIKPIVRDFLRKRARYWVADGGDGALHWLVRSAMEVLEEEEFAHDALPITVPTKGGTIDFVANNVGIEGGAENILATLRSSIENGHTIEEAEVDSMLIEGVEITESGEQPFRTYGFAVAAGGVGQRFFSKYYEAADPNPTTILKVVANAVASLPVSLSPLRNVPGIPAGLRDYARELLQPTPAKLTIDGMVLSETDFTSIHIASMPINLGNVFRLFGKAEQDGVLHALVGSPSPFAMVRNLPRMHLGKEIRDRSLLDRACREMTVEATNGELLNPVVDGEYYRDVRSLTFRVGPRVRIPRIVPPASLPH